MIECGSEKECGVEFTGCLNEGKEDGQRRFREKRRLKEVASERSPV